MDGSYLKEELFSLVCKNKTLFEFLQNASLDGVWYWDLQNPENEWMNERFWSLLGYDPKQKEHLSLEWKKLIHPEDLKLVEENLKKHMKDPLYPYDQIVRYKHKDGSTVWVRCRGMAIRDEEGKAIRMFGAHNDLTEIMQLREKTLQHEMQLQEMVTQQVQQIRKQESIIFSQSKLAAMGEMIGAIAHQWRQPLNELSIRIQKLKYSFAKGSVDADFIEDFIAKNKNTIDFMSKTIDDFRNFFRIEKTKTSFSLTKAVQEVLAIQSAQLKNHNITVSLQGEGCDIIGYKSEVQQVMINLISNAKDAFLENKIADPCLEITLQNNEILIQDNGGGIEQKIIEKVFEPYFTTKDEKSSTGMGLYLSKMIIEQNMHGTLTLHNKKNGVLAHIVL